MKPLFKNLSWFFLTTTSLAFPYENVTPVQVHTRLVAADTLILLDVREVREYRDGHIAEPAGRLPLTPANMPLTSNVLAKAFHLLPQDKDIIVYCGSGGRSAVASAFLESQGFTRIYNMLVGFSSWPYESRDGGYGDHSGKWIGHSNANPVMITAAVGNDTSRVVISPGAASWSDSVYMELHLASSGEPLPPDVPQTDAGGLYRLTVLDPHGLSLLDGDSLAPASPIDLTLLPATGTAAKELVHTETRILNPGIGWLPVPFTYSSPYFFISDSTIRRWYHVCGSFPTGVAHAGTDKDPIVAVYPNPFNHTVQIVAPTGAGVNVYDLKGREIEQLRSKAWTPPLFLASGVYIIRVQYSNRMTVRKVLYLK